MTSSAALGIAVIGSGYTAASVLTHLLEAEPDRAGHIGVFGPAPFGHGAAFGTTHPDFRLNVRAQIMQLRPARPGQFLDWAADNLRDAEAHCPQGAFYRRTDFARYINAEMDRLAGCEEVRFNSQTVMSVRYDNSSGLWQLGLEDGQVQTAEMLVLATGNPQPDWPCPIDEVCQTKHDGRLVRSPWSGDWLAEVDPEHQIVIVGGGLTAMDAVYALGRAGHRGRIQIVTPVGLLPPAQTDWIPGEAIIWPEDISSAAEIVGFINRRLKQGRRYPWTDPVWQSRFEALRVNLNPVWRRLVAAEKRRLIARLGTSWSLARYRSAPQTSAMAQKLITSGQLDILTGRVVRLSSGSAPARLSAQLSTGAVLQADYIVNCTGMGRDRLLADMQKNNLVRPDAFGRGPDLADDLRLCTPSGHAYPSGYALGPLTAGSEGDVVGATTISRQAVALVRHIQMSKS